MASIATSRLTITALWVLVLVASSNTQVVAKEFAKVDLSADNVIHARAVAMVKGLSKNFSKLNARAANLAISRLEDYLARKEAIQFWTSFTSNNTKTSYDVSAPTTSGIGSNSSSNVASSSGRRLLQTTNTLPDGIYRISYAGSGACQGKFLSYKRYDKTSPANVNLASASSSNPVLWQVQNVVGKNQQITLNAINRASCCPEKLGYPRSSSCSSSVVDLGSPGSGLRL